MGSNATTLKRTARRAAVARAVEATKVYGTGDTSVVALDHVTVDLPGRQQQRVAMARALASRPEIIFADEPTGNLDSRSSAGLLGFMRTSVEDLGQTIVMVTHDPVAAAYADSVLFLADGHLVDSMVDPTAKRVLDRLKSFGDEAVGADR